MLERDDNTYSEGFIATQNSGEIINTSDTPNPFVSKDSTEEQDQDKIQVLLQDFQAEYTNVTNILREVPQYFKDKDRFDVIKFTIKVKAVYKYSWEVYRKPSEVKKNFADIHSELTRNFMEPTGKDAEIFNTMAAMEESAIKDHITDIQEYYRNFFQNIKIYNTLPFKEFFNISNGSFNQYNSGSKPFEGYCYKKADPQCLRTIFSIACKCIEYFAFSQYNLRWIVVKDDCIYYSDKSNSDTGKNVYFFDESLSLEKDKDTITIKNISRSLILKFKTIFETEIWYKEIKRRSDAMKDILKNNKYKSYTNEKKGNSAHWFSDGEDYFKDLSEKLMQAKETIFITDWWLSPEVWLTRPAPTQEYMALAFQKKSRKETPPYSRLMDILFQCANKGVKVYVLVYAECSLALTLNSSHSQHALEALHPNIQVERHPVNCTDLLWSHHEKLVIIDQIIGYVGGLDLCWGRWDTHDHPIFEEPNNNQNYLFPGIDYSNARIRDFDKVEKYLEESCKRDIFEVRMPWHDVHSRLIGPVVADIARHFVERWNFSRFGTGSGITDIKQNASVSKQHNQLKETNTLDESLSEKDQPKKGGFIFGIIDQVNENEKENQNSNDSENALMPESEIDTGDNTNKGNFPGGMMMKGKTKLRGKKKGKGGEISISGSSGNSPIDFTKKKGYEEQQALRARYFKNIEVVDEDHLYVRKGQGKLRGRRLNDKIKKIKMAKQNNSTQSQVDINPGQPTIQGEEEVIQEEEEPKKSSFYDKFVKDVSEQWKNNQKGSWFSNFLGPSEEKALETNVVNVNFFKKGIKSNVQVLRSASKWSVGIGKKENSILQGYYHLIDNAKHYLYIENQFFVSRAFNDEEMAECDYALSDVVENLIAYHIRKRIERAYHSNEKFRVFVFIPLLPGFAGEPESSGTLQIILKHTYAGICRNHGMSIIEQLSSIMGEKWRDYIGFYSLRGHALVNGEPRTELIYIHSKLMIVDDTTVILGSANINDRSMLGTRDSEYAVMINENPKLESVMNGQPFKAANFAYTFRVNLFAEHLGVDPKNKILADPLSDEFLNLVRNTAKNNTTIYRELWGCYPDDNYTSFKDLKEHKPLSKEELLEKYKAKKNEIVGHAVEFPLKFLENENLGIAFFSVENLVPEKNFT
jgi:phospholipase D1/2